MLHSGIDVVVDGVSVSLQEVVLAVKFLCRVSLESLTDLRETLAFHPYFHSCLSKGKGGSVSVFHCSFHSSNAFRSLNFRTYFHVTFVFLMYAVT